MSISVDVALAVVLAMIAHSSPSSSVFPSPIMPSLVYSSVSTAVMHAHLPPLHFHIPPRLYPYGILPVSFSHTSGTSRSPPVPSPKPISNPLSIHPHSVSQISPSPFSSIVPIPSTVCFFTAVSCQPHMLLRWSHPICVVGGASWVEGQWLLCSSAVAG